MRVAQSSTTSANASFPAARSSIGRRRHAGSTRKNVYATYCPSTGMMLALAGGADEHPAERVGRLGRLAALVGAGVDAGDRLLDERAARLRGAVGVVDARLPPVVVRLVGDVEDQESADGRLAGSHLQRFVVVRRLDSLADGLGRRRLLAAVEAPLRRRDQRIDAVLVVHDRQLRAE